jgi:NAD(P)-dependent dehydrogenase (short-subunit alcohol dehydrogenase family)
MTKRRVLITGGARRIGAVVARSLASDGWDVVVHYNTSRSDAEQLAIDIRQHGGSCGLIQADLSDLNDIDSLIPTCIDAYGPLDCLINNAASFINDDISSVSWDTFHYQTTTNLGAPLFLSQSFARSFGERTGGCIINMLDQKVGNLNPDFLSYTLSKVGLSGLTQVLSMAFKSRIRVCGIAPGVTLISGKQTEEGFQRAWRATPSGRSSTPEEIANCVRFILTTPSLTGHTIVLDGGESVRGRSRDVAFDLDAEPV